MKMYRITFRCVLPHISKYWRIGATCCMQLAVIGVALICVPLGVDRSSAAYRRRAFNTRTMDADKGFSSTHQSVLYAGFTCMKTSCFKPVKSTMVRTGELCVHVTDGVCINPDKHQFKNENFSRSIRKLWKLWNYRVCVESMECTIDGEWNWLGAASRTRPVSADDGAMLQQVVNDGYGSHSSGNGLGVDLHIIN